MKTVLVTGGAGYIGSVVTEQLLDAGHRVKVLDRMFFGRHLLAPLEKREGLTIVKDDIRYAGPEVFDGVDVVMDLAGISNDPSADLAPGDVFQTISRGYGVMPSYATALSVPERWAIVGYVQALQLSQATLLAELPPELAREFGARVQ